MTTRIYTGSIYKINGYNKNMGSMITNNRFDEVVICINDTDVSDGCKATFINGPRKGDFFKISQTQIEMDFLYTQKEFDNIDWDSVA